MALEPIQKKQGADWSSGIIALLLALCTFLFYDYPKYMQLKQDRLAITDSNQSLSDLNTQKTQLLQSVNAIEQNKDQFRSVNLAVPDQAGIPDIYADIELLAKASNMNLVSIQADDPTLTQNSADAAAALGTPAPAADATLAGGGANDNNPPPSLGTVHVRAELSGTTLQLKQFLSAMEQSLRFIDVQQIDITEEQNQQMSFHIEFNTYYQRK